MKIVICDDVPFWLDEIRAHVTSWADKKGVNIEVHCFGETSGLTEYILSNGDIDAVVLDIKFGENERDGLAAASHIRRANNDVPIILLTADAGMAAKGYIVDAIGFVTKPVDQVLLNLYLDKIYMKMEQHRVIVIGSGSNMISICPDQVYYAEVKEHEVFFHTQSGTVSIRSTLESVCNLLAVKGFIRIHRLYIVATKRIVGVKTSRPYAITLAEDTTTRELPVGRAYVKGLMNAFAESVLEASI